MFISDKYINHLLDENLLGDAFKSFKNIGKELSEKKAKKEIIMSSKWKDPLQSRFLKGARPLATAMQR